MKNRLFVLLLLTSFNSFAQTPSPLFSEQLSLFNPAASGLFHSKSVFLRFQGNKSPNYDRYFAYGAAGYQQKVAVLHGGLGISAALNKNYSRYQNGDLNYDYRSQGIALSYSYHLNFRDSSTLAFGANLAYAHGYSKNYANVATESDVATGALGVLYRRNHWYFGVALGTFLGPDLVWMDYNLTAGYLFNLGDRVTLQPQVIYSEDGQFSLSATLDQRFWVKTQFDVNYSDYGVILGADIQRKLRIGYGWLNVRNTFIWQMGMAHHFTFSYLIK